MRTRTRSWRRLVGLATLLLLVTAAACGDDDGGDVRSLDNGSGSGSASGSGSGAHGSGSGSGSGSASGAHGEEAACEEPAGGAAGEGTLSATLTDYKIALDEPTATAGATIIVAANEGQHPHEIVVAKGVTADQLTYDSKGVVDEDVLPKGAVLGEIEEFDPGKQCQAEFDLEPDTYTLFCNVVEGGQSHARMGMVTELTVG